MGRVGEPRGFQTRNHPPILSFTFCHFCVCALNESSRNSTHINRFKPRDYSDTGERGNHQGSHNKNSHSAHRRSVLGPFTLSLCTRFSPQPHFPLYSFSKRTSLCRQRGLGRWTPLPVSAGHRLPLHPFQRCILTHPSTSQLPPLHP